MNRGLINKILLFPPLLCAAKSKHRTTTHRFLQSSCQIVSIWLHPSILFPLQEQPIYRLSLTLSKNIQFHVCNVTFQGLLQTWKALRKRDPMSQRGSNMKTSHSQQNDIITVLHFTVLPSHKTLKRDFPFSRVRLFTTPKFDSWNKFRLPANASKTFYITSTFWLW